MNDRHGSKQDIVDRAVGALRQTYVPASAPPEGLAARLTEAEALEAMKSPKSIIRRILTMKHRSKIAGAVAAAAIVIVVTMLTIGNGAASIAWADVQRQIRNARTMTYKTKVELEGLPAMETTVMLKEPGLMRMELTMGSSKVVTIMDIKQSKMIRLIEAQKKATIFDLKELPAEIRKEQEKQDFLAGIKTLIEESETELGEKKIDGRAVKGYRVEKGNQTITIWADAETARPVEMTMSVFQGKNVTTMSDFKFDVELDDSLFSVEVPKGQGYTVDKQQMEVKEGSADDLVDMLRTFARIRGGTFPDALTPATLMKDTMSFVKAGKEGKLDDKKLVKEFENADQLQKSLVIARAMVLVTQHGEAQYAGKGVKLGDAKTAIFWYKPKDSETYKVIYGDLRIEDVAPENLPKPPEEAKTPK